MKIKNQQDFWAGLFFIAAGLAFTIGASNLALGSSAQPGPAFFPLLLGLALDLLGCLMIFKALTFETDDGRPVGAIAWRALLVVIGSVLLGGWLLPWLGMLLTAALLCALFGLAAGRLSLRRWLTMSGVSMALSWFAFIVLAESQIPLWPGLAG